MEIYRSDAGAFIRSVFHLTTLLSVYLFGISSLSFAVFSPLIFLDFIMIQAKKRKWQFFFIIEPSKKIENNFYVACTYKLKFRKLSKDTNYIIIFHKFSLAFNFSSQILGQFLKRIPFSFQLNFNRPLVSSKLIRLCVYGVCVCVCVYVVGKLFNKLWGQHYACNFEFTDYGTDIFFNRKDALDRVQ